MEKPLKIISEIKTPRLTARRPQPQWLTGFSTPLTYHARDCASFSFWVDNVQKVEDERKTLSDFAEGWEKG